MNNFRSFRKDFLFQSLVNSVKICNLCPRMKSRPKILSKSNGNYYSKVVFIAEAPGRLGADRTLVPLYGDKAGDNFNKLLGSIGWKREDIFITNSLLCNPREENGNNSTPTRSELLNCSLYLHMTLNLINPDVIVTLGSTALKSLSLIKPHSYNLKQYTRKLVPWFGKHIYVAYHPGQRAMLHRSFHNQISDFYQLSKLVDPVNGIKKAKKYTFKIGKMEHTRIKPVINLILFYINYLGRLSKFKLAKLLFLTDYYSYQKLGYSFTKSVHLRQVDGPWMPDMEKAIRILKGHEIEIKHLRHTQYIQEGPNPRYEPIFDEAQESFLQELADKYGCLSNAGIKMAVYKSDLMQNVLKEENAGKRMLNKPILYYKK